MAEERIRLRGTPEELATRIPELLDLYQIIKTRDVGTIYADVSQRINVKRKEKPKVVLYFLEDTDYERTGKRSTTPHGRKRDDGVISFRLMDETSKTFTKANGKALGQKIKEVFGSNGGFVWNKGKTYYSYTDWEKGYQLQLLCRSKAEAKRIATATLSIKGNTPDWENLQEVKNDQEDSKYPVNPGTEIIMGETVDKPVIRPVVDVRFQYAYVKLNGLTEPINLYDRTGKRIEALVT